jgi:creatinine amidohydrolase/Fe(II)-dependent formamide hydrolase-like protein
VIRLAECTYRTAARLARDERVVIVLPLGAIEQHGPHLPLLVDWLGAEELARRIAPPLERAGYRVVLAPATPYGASPLAARWPGTVSLSRRVLRALIVDIVGNLSRHGFRRFVLANYQADPEHLRAMGEARRALGRRRPRVQVLFAGFSPGAGSSSAMVNRRVLRLLRSPRPELEWHSGELETALVLARRPDLVRGGTLGRLRPVWVDFRGALGRGARRFEDIAPGGPGYFGWPAAARAATATRAMKLRARLISRELIAALDGWRPGRGAAGGHPTRARPGPAAPRRRR